MNERDEIMQCNECNKRPATIHYTQFINGEKSEMHVCDTCAKNKGYPTHSEEGFSLQELLKGLFNVSSAQLDIQNESLFKQVNELKCDLCHSSFTDFQRQGKFGCANCYESFKPKLDSIFRRVHSGNMKHYGKIPKRKGGKLHAKKELAMYRDYLKQLIDEENFEEAAIIRDRIREIEEQKRGDIS